MNEVYPEFAEHLPPEVAEAVIAAEVGRWQGVTVPDFVAVFAARRVRAKLRTTLRSIEDRSDSTTAPTVRYFAVQLWNAGADRHATARYEARQNGTSALEESLADPCRMCGASVNCSPTSLARD
jgi:hypothetical protein